MTLNQYYLKHGNDGLVNLAAKCEIKTKLSYLQQLIYIPSKRPSLLMASALVKASDNELTYEGLAHPVKVLKRDVKEVN